MNKLIFSSDLVRIDQVWLMVTNIMYYLSTIMGSRKYRCRDVCLYVLAGFIIIIFLLPMSSKAQNCPDFKITEVLNTTDNLDNGSIEVDIKAARKFTTDNFNIRQKEKQVTGQLGYEVEVLISNDKLIIKGLKKSQDMYLGEYVILFSDKTCKNGELLEVGTFKIK